MRWTSTLLLSLLVCSALCSAADAPKPAVDAKTKAPQGSDKAPGNGKKKPKKVESLDLNQVDLEQVEEDWDSTPKKPSMDVGNSVRIREIVEPLGEYSYASFGRPDPFTPPELSIGAGEGPPPRLTSPSGKEIPMVSVLQGYPLSDLSVKGLWQLASGETRAVVLTPRSEGVVVKEGDPISSGKVLQINRDQLLVRLYRLRSDGVREYEDVSMKIGPPSKSDKGVIKLEPGKDPIFVNPDTGKTKPVPLGQALDAPVTPKSPIVPTVSGVPSVQVPAALSAAPAAGAAQTEDGKPIVAPVRPGATNPLQPVKNPINGAPVPPQ